MPQLAIKHELLHFFYQYSHIENVSTLAYLAPEVVQCQEVLLPRNRFSKKWTVYFKELATRTYGSLQYFVGYQNNAHHFI